MESYDYLIVGGGQVAHDAACAIRDRDVLGSIGILSADGDAPYTRPALTKKLWTDPGFSEDEVPLSTAERTGADVRLHTRVTAIMPMHHVVVLEGGGRLQYGKLLLATGSEPTTLPGSSLHSVVTFRTLEDYRRLRMYARPGTHAVVVGGGYIGSELASSLAQNEVLTTLVYPDAVLGAGRFPDRLAARHEDLFREAGVRLFPTSRADRIEDASAGPVVLLDDGSRIRADVVAVGLGASPRLQLAQEAGLEVRDGVVVDEHLRTSEVDIWAAGDIAEYPDSRLGRSRIEHVDHARESGRVAGAAMVDPSATYTHTPFFYSVVFDHRWEAVGDTDPSNRRPVQVDLDEERTVVAYLDDDEAVRGVLLWGIEDGQKRGDPETLRDLFA
jgi:NADPH-dependent 2,4-dienoyl-CoA reductase/sulfur reductase-like enzyme